MSEEDNQIAMELNDPSGGADLEGMATEAAPIEDFDQNGLLLKIAVNGITVQDYVKRLRKAIYLLLLMVKFIVKVLLNSEKFLKVSQVMMLNGYCHSGETDKYLIFS